MALLSNTVSSYAGVADIPGNILIYYVYLPHHPSHLFWYQGAWHPTPGCPWTPCMGWRYCPPWPGSCVSSYVRDCLIGTCHLHPQSQPQDPYYLQLLLPTGCSRGGKLGKTCPCSVFMRFKYNITDCSFLPDLSCSKIV